jgi:hypothetical protein
MMEFREQITIGMVFFVFAYFAGLGFWQIVAAWQGLGAFSWLPRGAKARWGYLAGSLVLALACGWFFGTRTEDIFCPGPASSEFLFFLGLGLLLSLGTSMIASALVHRFVSGGSRLSTRHAAQGQPVSGPRWNGTLHRPSLDEGPCCAVCLVPEPGTEVESLAAELAGRGIVALVLDMDYRDVWKYPDVLAAIPRALDFLEDTENVDANRLGLLGVGIGADLVIRAAASDPQVRTAVAIAPLLSPSGVQPGLDLLREMSYVGATRWRRWLDGGELIAQLDALKHMPELDPRPLLIILGADDRLVSGLETVESLPSTKVKKVEHRGRAGLATEPSVVSSTVSWFSRRLEGTS